MERDFTVELECKHCGKMIEVKVVAKDFSEFLKPNRRHIQDIFPYLTPSERELFISSTCDKCWNKMFAQDEE